MIFRGGHRAPRLIVDQPGGEATDFARPLAATVVVIGDQYGFEWTLAMDSGSCIRPSVV